MTITLGKKKGVGVDFDSRFICFINMCEFICSFVIRFNLKIKC